MQTMTLYYSHKVYVTNIINIISKGSGSPIREMVFTITVFFFLLKERHHIDVKDISDITSIRQVINYANSINHLKVYDI